MPAIVEGDYARVGTDILKVTAVAVDSGNGVLTVASATDIATSSAGTLDLIRPAITYSFTGTVDGFTRDMSTNEVMRYSLTIGSIASIETAFASALQA